MCSAVPTDRDTRHLWAAHCCQLLNAKDRVDRRSDFPGASAPTTTGMATETDPGVIIFSGKGPAAFGTDPGSTRSCSSASGAKRSWNHRGWCARSGGPGTSVFFLASNCGSVYQVHITTVLQGDSPFHWQIVSRVATVRTEQQLKEHRLVCPR